jgi:hypothetical protein
MPHTKKPLSSFLKEERKGNYSHNNAIILQQLMGRQDT